MLLKGTSRLHIINNVRVIIWTEQHCFSGLRDYPAKRKPNTQVRFISGTVPTLLAEATKRTNEKFIKNTYTKVKD